MGKYQFAIAFILPLMESTASWLENIDANSSGLDDKAAKALRVAAAALRELIAKP